MLSTHTRLDEERVEGGGGEEDDEAASETALLRPEGIKNQVQKSLLLSRTPNSHHSSNSLSTGAS